MDFLLSGVISDMCPIDSSSTGCVLVVCAALYLFKAEFEFFLQFAKAHGAKQGEEHKPAAQEKRKGMADLLEGPPKPKW